MASAAVFLQRFKSFEASPSQDIQLSRQIAHFTYINQNGFKKMDLQVWCDKLYENPQSNTYNELVDTHNHIGCV